MTWSGIERLHVGTAVLAYIQHRPQFQGLRFGAFIRLEVLHRLEYQGYVVRMTFKDKCSNYFLLCQQIGQVDEVFHG